MRSLAAGSAVALVVAAATLWSGTAEAKSHVSVDLGFVFGAPAYAAPYYTAGPAYYAPAPVYAPPPPTYYYPPAVVVPPEVYYAPPQIYYAPSPAYWHRRGAYWRHHHEDDD